MFRRVGWAMLAFAFSQCITIASNIVVVPLFLHAWSQEVYGEWLAMASAAGFLTSLDCGVQMYVVNRLTKHYAAGELSEYRAYAHSAFAFYVAIVMVGLAVAFICSVAFPFARWLNLTIVGVREARVVLLFLAAQVLLSIPLGLIGNIYKTTGEVARSAWVSNATRSAMVIFLALALWRRAPMWAVALTQLAPAVMTWAVVQLHLHQALPTVRVGFSGARWDIVCGMLRPSLLFAGIILACAIGLQGSSIAVANMFGAAALTVFATSRTLANIVRQLTGIVQNALWTELTRLDALEDRERLRLVLRMMVFGCTGVAIAVAASLWFEAESVITVWTHGKLMPDVALQRMFLAQVVLQTPWIAASALQLATNRHRKMAGSYLGSNIGGIIIGCGLCLALGAKGIPAGFIVAEALTCQHFAIRGACEIAKEKYGALARRLWLRLPFVVGAAGGMAWAAHQLRPPGVALQWGASGLLSACGAMAGAWWMWLGQDERLVVRAGMARFFRRRTARVAV